jgi:hypothetical protein
MANERKKGHVWREVRWLAKAQWVVIPLLVFMVIELLTRTWGASHNSGVTFWSWKEQSIRKNPTPHFFFIGSSRVAAAIDAQAFEEVVSRQFGAPVQAINFGAGSSCMAEHYLYLRNRFRKHPNELQGCVIFVETLEGLPETGRWRDRWYLDGSERLLLPLLKAEDLPRLWATGIPLKDRLYLTWSFCSRSSNSLAHRERLGQQFIQKGQQLVVKRLRRWLPEPSAGPTALADLTTAGGVRNDAESVARNRSLAIEFARRDLACQAPFRTWDGTIVADLVHDVMQAGGKVVFYQIPLHSVQANQYQTEIRRADRGAFEEQSRIWGAPLLDTGFRVPDDDFPDIWHLRKSRSREFTIALAHKWLDVTSGLGPAGKIASNRRADH